MKTKLKINKQNNNYKVNAYKTKLNISNTQINKNNKKRTFKTNIIRNFRIRRQKNKKDFKLNHNRLPN